MLFISTPNTHLNPLIMVILVKLKENNDFITLSLFSREINILFIHPKQNNQNFKRQYKLYTKYV